MSSYETPKQQMKPEVLETASEHLPVVELAHDTWIWTCVLLHGELLRSRGTATEQEASPLLQSRNRRSIAPVTLPGFGARSPVM